MAQTATLAFGVPQDLQWANASNEHTKAKAITMPPGTKRLRIKPRAQTAKSSNTGTADVALAVAGHETHVADIPEDIPITRVTHGHPPVIYLQMDVADAVCEVTAYAS